MIFLSVNLFHVLCIQRVKFQSIWWNGKFFFKILFPANLARIFDFMKIFLFILVLTYDWQMELVDSWRFCLVRRVDAVSHSKNWHVSDLASNSSCFSLASSVMICCRASSLIENWFEVLFCVPVVQKRRKMQSSIFLHEIQFLSLRPIVHCSSSYLFLNYFWKKKKLPIFTLREIPFLLFFCFFIVPLFLIEGNRSKNCNH